MKNKEKQNNEVEATLFNMSLATLERINDIFKYNNECSLTMQTQKWLLGLQTLLLEVSPMMDEEEEKKFNKLYEQINYNPNPITVKDRNENFDNRLIIQKADSFLRRILWDKGLTMAKKEDINKGML